MRPARSNPYTIVFAVHSTDFKEQSGAIEERARAALAAAEAELSLLRVELRGAQAERTYQAAELAQIASERNAARRELQKLREVIDVAAVRATQSADREDSLESEVAALKESLEIERRTRSALEQSASWRLTRPLRAIVGRLRRSEQKPEIKP